MSEQHEGWTNYPTWAVNLWISNSSSLYRYWLNEASDTYHSALAPILEREDMLAGKDATNAEAYGVAVNSLADQLEYDLTAAARGRLESFSTDILEWAMAQVNWREIAEAWLEDYAPKAVR
jgi:hypothetical protein